MDSHIHIEKIKIVFFSGTGSTTKVVNVFKETLESKGKIVVIHELNNRNSITSDGEDLLIVIYPVHACNAPEPIYEYINAISKVDKVSAAVISVSGGGEITPNTACRLHCIKKLEKKGFNVIYENMIVMPSNWIIPTVDGLAARLLKMLPNKVERMINDLLSGVLRRTKPNFSNRFFSYIGELEKYGSKSFGRKIKVSNSCNGCGWCAKSCPRTNISLSNGVPKFNDSCVLCLKCIYGCPQKALSPSVNKFIVIKQGYDFDAIEKQIIDMDKLDSVESLAKGYLWKGIKEYLLDENCN